MEFTGERFVAGMGGQIALEHIHRYNLAAHLCANKRVLDIASGEGYGTHKLSKVASHVIGVDISKEAVDHATRTYANPIMRQVCNLEFRQGSCTDIPVDSHSIDVVVSFETLEHIVEHATFLNAVKRVLAPGGILIISTPDHYEYSVRPNYQNVYHLKELSYEEFRSLMQQHFKFFTMLKQRVQNNQSIITWEDSKKILPMYWIAIASDYQDLEGPVVQHVPSHSLDVN
jgi:2-polyprenyl-3-methyl-5-hydroxy-6-metoxy-1,4-benzoquinol methylase